MFKHLALSGLQLGEHELVGKARADAALRVDLGGEVARALQLRLLTRLRLPPRGRANSSDQK